MYISKSINILCVCVLLLLGEFQNDVFVERLPPGAARTMLEKATCGSEPSHFGGGAQDSDVTPLCYLLGKETGSSMHPVFAEHSRIS